MRFKKDTALYAIEKVKISEQEDWILNGTLHKKYLLNQAVKIEGKKDIMQKFEIFLEKVKEQHSDEFQELHDILSRYKTLTSAKSKLETQQNLLVKELDRVTVLIAETAQTAITKKIFINNDISGRQQDLEKLEDKKNRMMAENQEVTSKKLKRTTEHGQILMSIDNIFRKCL